MLGGDAGTVATREVELPAPPFGIAPPGWYTDPGNPARQRWFDGTRWTDRVQATPAPTPVAPAPPRAAVLPPPPAAPVAEQVTVTVSTPHDGGKHAPVTNTPARAALVVAILAVLGVPVAAVVGIVLAVVGLRRATALESAGGRPVGRTRARWALGLSLVGVVIGAILVTVVVRAALSDGAGEGAGEPTGLIDTLAIESGISAGVSEETGVPTTVQCPEQLAVGKVTSFQCVAVDPDGVRTTVYVEIVDEAGNWTWELG